MKTKRCSKCKLILPIEQFNKHKETKCGLDCWCKSCKNKSTKRYYFSHKNKINQFMSTSPVGIYRRLKSGAKSRNITFNITQDDFIKWYNKQNKICCYCKRTLKETKKDIGKKCYRLSIDRKDNNKGYTLDNIVLCCHRCNTIKSNTFTYEQMMKVINILKE
jgi:hypothetical protein